MLLFRSEEHVSRWATQWKTPVGAIFSYVSRREIHGHTTRWHIEPGVGERSAHTFACFFHRIRREPDDGPGGEAGHDIHFDGNVDGVNAEHGGGADGGEHAEP